MSLHLKFYSRFKQILEKLQNFEKRLLALSCPSVRPHGTPRLSLFTIRKSVEKIQVSLSNRGNGYFIVRMHIDDRISQNYS
jgi:hypothetical protein